MIEEANFNRTKIVATIGPASSDTQTLKEMILSGVDVFRINFSHGDHESHRETVRRLREINEPMEEKIAILGDLQGPKIRIGEVENNAVTLVVGTDVILTSRQLIGNASELSISYEKLPQDVREGDKILMDDGKIQLEVVSSDKKTNVTAKVIYGGVISSKKGVNLPNTDLSTPSLTKKDIKDLELICECDFDWVALSFVRTPKDIVELRARINKTGADRRIIAKIEKPQAVDNIEEIIEVSDGIMVARGDLGVEIPIEYLPMIQKRIVALGMKLCKPVIIATQLMESMITAFMPTRAEAVDVANAVMEGADAVMLSAETSIGKHPIKVIKSMVRIISSIEMEKSLYSRRLKAPETDEEFFYSDSMCYIAVQTARHVNANAIVAMTQSGYTAQKIACYRPEAPVFVFTSNKKLLTQINLYWGARAYFYDGFKSTDATIRDVKDILVEKGHITLGDVIVNTASMPLLEKRRTNMIKLTVVDR